MPYHLPLELIFAGSLWLSAIIIFMIMLVATLASLRSSEKPDTKPEISSVTAKPNSRRRPRNRS